MDYDTYSANDAIGKVYLDLNPLLVTPGLSGRGIIRAETCSVPSSGYNEVHSLYVLIDIELVIYILQQEVLCCQGGYQCMTQCMECEGKCLS